MDTWEIKTDNPTTCGKTTPCECRESKMAIYMHVKTYLIGSQGISNHRDFKPFLWACLHFFN